MIQLVGPVPCHRCSQCKRHHGDPAAIMLYGEPDPDTFECRLTEENVEDEWYAGKFHHKCPLWINTDWPLKPNCVI